MKYDWKKTAVKVGKQIVYIIIAGLAATFADNPYWLLLSPMINGAENYLKHKND